MAANNDLRRFFESNTGGVIDKWLHYFDVYDRHFSRFRGTDVHVVEIGVFHGGSLRMWRDYFGPKARIYGVDVNPDCRVFAAEGFDIHIGDQADRRFLRELRDRIPRIDILIDDGGHTMVQQRRTFEELFPHVSTTGVYLCEDTHTSYWPEWGGGFRRRSTFMELAKDMVDWLNAWHSQQPDLLAVSDFTRSVASLHFYDSIVVIEKAPRDQPAPGRTGIPLIPENESRVYRFWRWLKGDYRDGGTKG